MPTRHMLASRIAVVVAAMLLAAGFANAPTPSADAPPASPTSVVDAGAANRTTGQAGLAKVVGTPMAKAPVALPAFAPAKGTLHPRVRAAYEHAAAVAKTRWRGCGLRWTILAAFGAVESANGTHHDGALVLEASGRVEPLIIGLPLDGRDGRGRILDTDGGEFDGNTVFDHAVGPMQFIPSTWQRHGADANGDGVSDPHSIDDASLAAASYLCTAARGNMRNNEALDRAIFSYNHSDAYVQTVRSQLTRFDLEFGFEPNPPSEPPPPPEEPAETPSPAPVEAAPTISEPPASSAPPSTPPSTTAPPTTLPPSTAPPTTTAPPTSTEPSTTTGSSTPARPDAP